jgi:3-methyladenine DNA glycosylase AlkD
MKTDRSSTFTPTVSLFRARIRALADPVKAEQARRFFRTGPGDYGEGDRFLGIRVPDLRALVREFRALPWQEATGLLQSEWHEERLLALLHWVQTHSRAEDSTRIAIHRAYLTHLRWVNNWDLVDSSAEHLVGPHLPRGGGPLLTRLASSSCLWERRVAMIATFYGIRRGDYDAALRMAKRLRDDPHDLIHKAVGWMLRELGKRAPDVERSFLDEHAERMPRTALRYAVERFPETERRKYLTRGR